MTITLERRSPVKLKGQLAKTEIRGGWRIVSEYAEKGKGPHIIDLSHVPRWDIQDCALDQVKPYGDMIPEMPGQIFMADNLLIGRLNGTQAVIWHFSDQKPSIPQSEAFTDITDSAVALALVGPSVFKLSEKLCALDISDPLKKTPFLIQGPFSHVPCHLWVLDRTEKDGCLVLTCSRGYASDMTHSILNAGLQWHLTPQGEDIFRKRMRW